MKLLTSTGLSSKDIFNIMPILQQQKGWKTVCIIVSADSKENKYMQLAKKQFEELNFSKIDFIDFFTQDINTIEQYNLIYIAGGNTFKLLNSITLHNKGLEIFERYTYKERCDKGKCWEYYFNTNYKNS
jgi:peptidase E